MARKLYKSGVWPILFILLTYGLVGHFEYKDSLCEPITTIDCTEAMAWMVSDVNYQEEYH
ncbi:MAG: hypothetical protein B6242_17520 [Anaerolineaceae bacterium 4572_78]|nr:MAG: hypothetical protein B6242_17520 [Anaerolineaceae bacterium 4572_78]